MESYRHYIAELGGGVSPEAYGVYPESVTRLGDTSVFMADAGDRDVLAVVGEPCGFIGRRMEEGGREWLECELDHASAARLREVAPYTAPVPVLRREFSFGCGDRLGIAGDGHIRVFNRFAGHPVLAQQSIRELNLTARTFADVLDSATFAVFRRGYRFGFGADGDHLKTAAEVRVALSCGYTMITLDCSEHINSLAATAPLSTLSIEQDRELEARYLKKRCFADGFEIAFDEASLLRMRLIYGGAIDFASDIYEQFFKGRDGVDFEISIDETPTPTSPAQHYFIANELRLRGVSVCTIAPRFTGEFQKGIDYIGDLAGFEEEFQVHAAIAREFGYKLSIHSGSDKFSVFPIIGRYTGGRVHVKTAGTNWLEAMRVVAEKKPSLYREVHKYALMAFEDARKYYHVTTDLSQIPDIDSVADESLPALFELPNARQLIHITYGLILTESGFRECLFRLWRREREAYSDRIFAHIGRHVTELMKET